MRAITRQYQSGLGDDFHLILDWDRTENRSKLLSPFFASIQNRKPVVSNVEPSNPNLFDYLHRSVEYLGWNYDADLISGLEIER